MVWVFQVLSLLEIFHPIPCRTSLTRNAKVASVLIPHYVPPVSATGHPTSLSESRTRVSPY